MNRKFKIIISYFAVFFFVFNVTNSFSQNSFSIKCGMSINNAFFTVDSLIIDTKFKNGGLFGIDYARNLTSVISMSSGIVFIQKGYSIDNSVEISYKLNYIKVPIGLNFKFDLETFYIFFNSGTYFAVPINGRYFSEDDSRKVNFGSKNGCFKRFDYGISIGWGIEIEKFLLSMDYDIGFFDIASSSNERIKNRSISFSVGYKF